MAEAEFLIQSLRKAMTSTIEWAPNEEELRQVREGFQYVFLQRLLNENVKKIYLQFQTMKVKHFFLKFDRPKNP